MRNRTLVLLMFLVSLPRLASALTNLVPNPRFDADVNGWYNTAPLHATVDHGPLDESGKAEAGSLRFHDITVAGNAHARSACFVVSPGQDVVFGASFFTPGSADNNAGWALLVFWEDATCGGAQLGEQTLQSDLNKQGGGSWGPVQGFGRVPIGVHGARLALGIYALSTPAPEMVFDNAFVYQGVTCATTANVACLDQGRFRVDVEWWTADGQSGFGKIRAFSNGSDSAYATFFDEGNVEMVIKVLNACALNQRHWVFAAGLTDVQVGISVKDTQVGSGQLWQYQNPLHHAFPPVQDVNALDSCPH